MFALYDPEDWRGWSVEIRDLFKQNVWHLEGQIANLAVHWFFKL
jgi:hypothetical protein